LKTARLNQDRLKRVPREDKRERERERESACWVGRITSPEAGNTKGGGFTVLLPSCLIGLELAV